MDTQRQTIQPALLGGLFCLAWVCLLVWPLPLHLSSWHGLSAFGDSHIWVFEQSSSRLGSGDLAETSCEAGYPFPRHMRSIAWVPGLFFMLLEPLLGAIASTQLLQLLSLPVSGVMAGFLVQRWTGCSPWTAQAMGIAYALCPTHLSHLATGEISNTQAWIIPAWLLAMSAKSGHWNGILLTAGVTLMAAFSSPYSALALPLIGGAWIAGILWNHRLSDGLRQAKRQLYRLAATGLALLPAWLYYAEDRAGGGESIFQPARRAIIEVGPLPHPSPIATPGDLIWSAGGSAGSPYEPVHSAYIGLVLLALAVWAAWRTRENGRRAGLVLLIGGALLSLGPALALGGRVLPLGDGPFPLPAALLEAVAYPTQIGGLYYRFTVIAVLGACILGASGLARRPHGARWAWALLLLHLSDSTRGTPSQWPRPSEPIAGSLALQELQGTDGAVLELPIQGPTDAWFGQSALLRATLHKRPTTSLPRGVWNPRGSVQGLWDEVMDPSSTLSTREQLSLAGFRLVLLPEDLIPHVEPDLSEIEKELGPPIHAEGLLIWDLGPSASLPSCASGG